MLNHLHRIHLGTVLNKISAKDCWGDCPMWDIPNTMLSAVKTAAPQIKALTFVHSPCDEQIRAACRERDIIIVWADPPDFVRYLDEN